MASSIEFTSVLCGATLLAAVTLASPARADIENPNDHPGYSVEVEPHLAADTTGDDQMGLGLRLSFEILDPGFVPSASNTVALGVGFDYLFDGDDDYCNRARCFDDRDTLHIPLVVQWNFWFSPYWSAFGEPGVAIQLRDDEKFGEDFDGDNNLDVDLALYLGGRFHFSERTALTLRVGSPVDLGLGFSFLM
ncbi:MAG: hypothetical protein RJA70_4526 [Pseudomonadota bacterium]|jgi:hypothetical protein